VGRAGGTRQRRGYLTVWDPWSAREGRRSWQQHLAGSSGGRKSVPLGWPGGLVGQSPLPEVPPVVRFERLWSSAPVVEYGEPVRAPSRRAGALPSCATWIGNPPAACPCHLKLFHGRCLEPQPAPPLCERPTDSTQPMPHTSSMVDVPACPPPCQAPSHGADNDRHLQNPSPPRHCSGPAIET